MSESTNLTIDIDKITNLYCHNTRCLNNLASTGGANCCKLKYVVIDGAGKCSDCAYWTKDAHSPSV